MRHLLLLLLALAPGYAVAGQASPARPLVRNAADLPSVRYPVAEQPSRYVFTDGFVRDLVPRLRIDAERALTGSDFVDARLRRNLAGGLAAIALLQGRANDAERIIAEQRTVETQPQLRALALLPFDALAAVVAVPGRSACDAGGRRLTERLAGMNPAQARAEVSSRWSQMQLTSPAFDAAGLVGADRNANSLGGVNLLEGLTMARIRAAATLIPPCRDALSAPLRAWLDAPANAEVNIWPEREPSAEALNGAAPVTVAVWDTGIDYTLFAGRLAFDPAEPFDGHDNDGNGVVDDVHGPTFDGRILPSAHPMQAPSPLLEQRYLYQAALYEGEREHGLGLDTPASRLFASHARTASPEEQAMDVRLSAELGYRRHGTFVASQISEGLPFVRLYNVRLLNAASAPEPIVTAEAEMGRFVAQIRPTLRRMRAAGVRVVNMSWDHVDDGGRSLIESGQETDPERARRRARAMSDAFRDAWQGALAETPDILFVIASGNDGSRSEDVAPIPSALPFPNIVVVGAVGPGGGAASFTSFGERVRLYANGGLARGRTPGGGWNHSAGTSMAAPLVVRTAAQMLAVNPSLTPVQLIEGMVATATVNSQGLRLVHPAAGVDWARRSRR